MNTSPEVETWGGCLLFIIAVLAVSWWMERGRKNDAN